MSFNIEDTIKAIRSDCRLAMNGVVSTSMREYGLDYKLNFGLINQQIKTIADKYGPSSALAERLWTETTRELKILATLVYPPAEFTEENANSWVADIPNQEIREQACFNLFQHLPYAQEIAKKWISDANKGIRTTGYWLIARLFLSKRIEKGTNLSDLGEYILEDIASDDVFLRKSSISVLKYLIRESKEQGEAILKEISSYKESKDNQQKTKAYQEIASEFDFLYL